MRILVTGGTGLIGRALCAHWQRGGHEVIVTSREPRRVAALCAGARGIGALDDLEEGAPLDAVVNLAGAPIADGRWTAARRELLWNSRVESTRRLVAALRRRTAAPKALLSGSAVGWYGDSGERTLDESSPRLVDDYGAELCEAWEHEALQARAFGMRVVLLRTAPVLARSGGMLDKLRPVYALGLGGPLGNGRQWMPWIHIDDVVGLIDHLMLHASIDGAVNLSAPQQVRNAEFSQTLASTLHRPAWLRTPAWALRSMLGDMSVLLLGSQRVEPRRALESGYEFHQPALAAALAAALAHTSAEPPTSPSPS